MGQYHLVVNLTRKEFIHPPPAGRWIEALGAVKLHGRNDGSVIPSPRLLKW